MNCYLYNFGKFEEIPCPFDPSDDLDHHNWLANSGFHGTPSLTLGHPEIPIFELYETDINLKIGDREPAYRYYGNINIGNVGRDIYFNDYPSVLHFLQNYMGWVNTAIATDRWAIELDRENDR